MGSFSLNVHVCSYQMQSWNLFAYFSYWSVFNQMVKLALASPSSFLSLFSMWKKHPILLKTALDRVLIVTSDNVHFSFILHMSTLLWPFMLLQTRLLDDKCHPLVVKIYRHVVGSGAARRSASPSSLLVIKLSTINSLKINWKMICISGRETSQDWKRSTAIRW